MTNNFYTIPISRVNELLSYDPESGLFYRKVKTSYRSPEGFAIGSIRKDGYLSIRLDGVQFKMHRLAWAIHYGEWPSDQIDHINTIKTDNRICNLRIANSHQNQCNKHRYRTNKCGIKGVSMYRGLYKAQISVKGKVINLGTRNTAEEARELYKAAAIKFHGDYAKF